MKKKYHPSSKDKKDLSNFTENFENVYDRESGFASKSIATNKVKRLDLHGLSLDQANKTVKKFIIESFEKNCQKLIVITGKGLRSKVHENPYISEKLNILRNSVPAFIKDDEDLKSQVSKVSEADIKDGGEGAIYIFLKNDKKFIG